VCVFSAVLMCSFYFRNKGVWVESLSDDLFENCLKRLEIHFSTTWYTESYWSLTRYFWYALV